MNYLAHAYLSFYQPGILEGNMISDFVKGKKQYEFPAAIQKGIKLHRSIDEFTDNHPITRKMKAFFRQEYGLYAAPLTDIVYDYYLANDKNEFGSASILKEFSASTYSAIDQHLTGLPVKFQQLYVYMKQYDWLYNYRYEWSMQKAFEGLARRAKYMRKTDIAFKIFQNNTNELRSGYQQFFPLLKEYTAYRMEQLLKAD